MMISVIVPVYKVEPYLNRCIDSVINQTLTDFELILTDDGSPDACGGICDEYAVNDDRLVIIHQQNGGLSVARNVGIDWSFACSDSEWISFIDSDDYVSAHYLQLLYDAVQKTQTEISICGFQLDDAGQILARDTEHIEYPISFVKSVEDAWLDPDIQTISAWGYLYRKKLFDQIRYPVGRINEDSFTTYKLVFQCERIAWVPTKLYYYNNEAFSITRSPWSPRKLDDLDARKQMITFFSSKGDERLYLGELKSYLYVLATNTINSKVDAKYRMIHQKLRKELRSKLKQYNKILDLKIGNNVYYVAAYPKITYFYCIFQAVKKKLTSWSKVNI